MTATIGTALAAALVKAQAAAKAVAHDATNSHHRYDYTSAEAIIGEARAALNSAGLAVVQADWNITSADVEWTDGDGKAQKDQERTLHVRFLVIHESGETMTGAVEVPVLPEKGRPLDKASFSALTYAESYYLRGLLCLPRVSPSDNIDQRDDTKHEPRAAARSSAPRPMPNKFAGYCASCSTNVPEGEGTSFKGGDGKWAVRHLEGRCTQVASATAPDTGRTVPNVDAADCTHCNTEVAPGKGWQRGDKVIHAACAKELKAVREHLAGATR